MKMLICAATKYGATGEIAQAVADVLAGKGLDASMVPPDQVSAIEEFDAVVLGSVAGHQRGRSSDLSPRDPGRGPRPG